MRIHPPSGFFILWDDTLKLCHSMGQQYRLNMEFLRVAANRGQEILLSANAYAAPANSAFASEIRYLLSRGYRIVDEGWRMIR